VSGNSWLRRAWSGSGNGGVATVTPSGPHRPARCRDRDCERALCAAYREGREDGYADGREDGHEDGHEDGYREGYRDGYRAAAAAARRR
jgi:hypothetical protein